LLAEPLWALRLSGVLPDRPNPSKHAALTTAHIDIAQSRLVQRRCATSLPAKREGLALMNRRAVGAPLTAARAVVLAGMRPVSALVLASEPSACGRQFKRAATPAITGAELCRVLARPGGRADIAA